MSSPKAIITVENGHIYATSLVVAEKFEKRHDNVLRDIETIIKKCPVPNFSLLNFEERKYQYRTARNQLREAPYYVMTRKGFTMLARGFTGEKAFLWNLAYIEAFERMEAKLRQLGDIEHEAIMEGLYGKHDQWRETVEYCRQGKRTGEIATLQGKCASSVRAMKARIRKAGINIAPLAA